jgi:hypothetical protein
MKGKIIDKNITDAFVNFEDGNTMDIPLAKLPKNVHVGDTVEFTINTTSNLTNDKLVDFF